MIFPKTIRKQGYNICAVPKKVTLVSIKFGHEDTGQGRVSPREEPGVMEVKVQVHFS